MTWSEYIQSPAGQHPVLGRAPKCKESSRAFKATVAMSEDFPLTVEMLLNVLEVIAPQFKHFQKLRDFIEMKLPPGFPVKVDIPVLPTVSARVTFHDFHWKNEEKLSDELFSIPEGYVPVLEFKEFQRAVRSQNAAPQIAPDDFDRILSEYVDRGIVLTVANLFE